jgi:ribosomal protein L21E
MRKAMTEYKKGQRVKVELEAEILGAEDSPRKRAG